MGRAHFFSFVLLVFAATPLAATVSVQLNVPTSTIQVGETLRVMATASDSSAPNTRFSYQFTVRPHNQGPFVTMQDYYFNNTFPWTPSDHEGSFDIGVTAWSAATGASGATFITVAVQSRVTGAQPVLSNTNNALVALYSAPACAAPAQMRVKFSAPSAPTVFTPYKPCDGLSMNFYIAGMLENTAYTMQHQLSSGAVGPQVKYTTASIPADIVIPNHIRLAGPTPPTSETYPYLIHSVVGNASAFATDLNENVVWYKPPVASYNVSSLLTHPIMGGTFLAIEDDLANSKALCQGLTVPCADHQYLREYDVAGNVIRQTSWSILNDRINASRAKQGRKPVRLNYLSHEGIRLPNGYTATFGTDEQVKQGASGTKDYFGDTVIVLNAAFQVVWAWDTFDYLDINRQTIPATCTRGGQACPQQYFQKQPNGQLYTTAVDWTHTNSISYDPRDGNLVISVRHQSWAIKIAYQNGTGDGHIIWKLGFGGSFALPAGSPITDWFSGQHDVEVQPDGTITLFDNNNPSTVTHQPGGTARGQAWRLDTTNMIATPIENIDLGVVSQALGSSRVLSNGNYEWQAGFIGGNEAITFEYTPSGTLVYKQQTDSASYRSFRWQNLYTP